MRAVIIAIIVSLLGTPIFAEEKLPFAITVYKYAQKIALHYPHRDNVQWIRVCVVSEGKLDDKYHPGQYERFRQESCWQPRFGLEDYPLKIGTLTVTASLELKVDDEPKTLIVRAVVRPEPTEPNGNGPGEEQ